MNINDFDISKIKVAVFDYDDTLDMHKDKDFIANRRKSEDTRLEYYLNAYKNPDTFYDDIEPCERSEIMYNFICKLRKNNVKIYCLSRMKYSFHLKAKQAFINKYYGDDIEVLSAATHEMKFDGIRILQKLYSCELDEILFVDDREEVVNLMKNNGVKTLLVGDVTE